MLSNLIHSEAAREPTLLDIANDYTFIEELERKLKYSLFGNIKDLILRFPLSYKERCSIMSNVYPSRNFFTNLFKERPSKNLSDLQDQLEKRWMPNKMIFQKVNEVSLTSSYTLGELEKDRGMPYVWDNIADNLIPEDGTLLPTWKDIASDNGYSFEEIKLFCEVSTSTEPTARKLLSLLISKRVTLSAFIQKLNDIRRNDIIKLVEDWFNIRMVRVFISSTVLKTLSLILAFIIFLKFSITWHLFFLLQKASPVKNSYFQFNICR